MTSLLFTLASLVSAPSFAANGPGAQQLDTICDLLLIHPQRKHAAYLRSYTESLRGWFRADFVIEEVTALPAHQGAPKDFDTVLRVQVEAHTPISGAQPSGEKTAQHVSVHGSLDLHLDGWDWTARELPVIGMRLTHAPIQILFWPDGRRYYRLDPTFVRQHIQPLLKRTEWSDWTPQERRAFVAKALERRRISVPGYRLFSTSLYEANRVQLLDLSATLPKILQTLRQQVTTLHPNYSIDPDAVTVTWLTDASDRLLAAHFETYGEFEFFFDGQGELF